MCVSVNVCGVFVSFVSGGFLLFADLVKCKLQAQLKPKAGEKPLFTGSFSAAAFIAKNYGIRGLYQGEPLPLATVASGGVAICTWFLTSLLTSFWLCLLSPLEGLQATVIRNSPAFGSYFFCNEMMKRALTPAGERPSRWVVLPTRHFIVLT